MRHCGFCGAAFDPAELTMGRCPHCGTSITMAGDIVIQDQDTIPQTTQVIFPTNTRQPLHTLVRDNRLMVGLAAFLVVALAFAVGIGWQIAAHGNGEHPSDTPVVGAGAPTDGATSTPANAATASALALTPTDSASPGVTPSVSPSPSVIASPSATPVPPKLGVVPTSVAEHGCLFNTPTLDVTVTNAGGGELDWSAQSSDYQLAGSTNGKLSHAQTQTFHTTVTKSGTITVTSNGGDQTVNVTCSLV